MDVAPFLAYHPGVARLDNQEGSNTMELTLPFPCGKRTDIASKAIRPESTFSCRHCGMTIRLVGDDLEKIQRALASLEKSLERLGKLGR
jgi:hypothetical protein